MPLEKDDENKPILKLQKPGRITDVMDMVSNAYDTLFGIKRKIFDRNLLLSFHRDVNNYNSFLQSFDLADFVNMGSETQFTDNFEILDTLYFLNFKFDNFSSRLFIEDNLERYVFDKGAEVGYLLNGYDFGVSYKLLTWDNVGYIEKVSDDVGLSVAKGNSFKLFSNVSRNHISGINSYFAGLQCAIGGGSDAGLSLGAEYTDYETPEVSIQGKASFSF